MNTRRDSSSCSRFLITVALLGLALLAAACGSDAKSGPSSDATVEELNLYFGGGSLPPEFHESSSMVLIDGVLTLTNYAAYEEEVVSEFSRELTQDELNKLSDLLRSAAISRVDGVEEDCTGVAIHQFTGSFSDGTSFSGHQDSRTYRDGPGGKCQSYNLSGDFQSVAGYLQSLRS